MDGEQTIPAWFSSVQLFLIGLVFLLKIVHAHAEPAIARSFLLLMGLGFMFLSADEATQIHEQLSRSADKFGGLPGFKGGHGYWIAAYGLIGVMLAVPSMKHAIDTWRQCANRRRLHRHCAAAKRSPTP